PHATPQKDAPTLMPRTPTFRGAKGDDLGRTNSMHTTITARHGCLAALLVAALAQLAGAQAENDDPFAPPTLVGIGRKANDVEVVATLTAEKLQPGEEAVLAITVRLPKDHYIYATTEKSSSRA